MTASFRREVGMVDGECVIWYDLRWPGGAQTVQVGPGAPPEDVAALQAFRAAYPHARQRVEPEKPDTRPRLVQPASAFEWARRRKKSR